MATWQRLPAHGDAATPNRAIPTAIPRVIPTVEMLPRVDVRPLQAAANCCPVRNAKAKCGNQYCSYSCRLYTWCAHAFHHVLIFNSIHIGNAPPVTPPFWKPCKCRHTAVFSTSILPV
ncbi:unnamed protein product [Laminaria digitata]